MSSSAAPGEELDTPQRELGVYVHLVSATTVGLTTKEKSLFFCCCSEGQPPSAAAAAPVAAAALYAYLPAA